MLWCLPVGLLVEDTGFSGLGGGGGLGGGLRRSCVRDFILAVLTLCFFLSPLSHTLKSPASLNSSLCSWSPDY